MRRNWMITAVLFLMTGNLSAQTVNDTITLSLDQALQIAMDENPTIKVADQEITLSKVARKESWQHLLPEATFNSRLDHTLQAAEMKLNGMKFKMGEDGTNSLTAAVSLNLPLYAPGVYKAMSISKTDIALALEKSRGTRIDLVNQVTKAYFQLLLAQDAYEVLQESYRVAEENYNVVCAKFDQGKVSEFDKISAGVQLRSIRPQLVSSANAISLAELQFRVLLGVDEVHIRLDDELRNYEKVISVAHLEKTDHDLENNTLLKQLNLNLEKLEKNIQMQRTNLLPTLGLSWSYQYQSIYNKDIHIFSYDWAGSSSLLFNLSIPIYKASNFTKMKTARLQRQQLEWNRQDTERKLNMEIQSYRNNMSASMEQLASNRENIKQAERAVTIANKRYEVGRGTVLELNNSQVSLTQAQLVYSQSIYDYLVAKADLDKAMGKETNLK